MQEFRDQSRAANRAKAKRMASATKGKIDASGWSEPTDMHAEAPTGLRPVSRRAYKSGGTVMGEEAKARGDRKPRKSGGATDMINRNVKEANEERDGVKHVGGMKKGGRAERGLGGKLLQPFMPWGKNDSEEIKERERSERKAGGRAKFEGSPKDEREDKVMAKKAGMSMKEWEKSAADKKHDAQRPEKGFGGALAAGLIGGLIPMAIKHFTKKKDGNKETTTSTTTPNAAPGAGMPYGGTKAKTGGRIKRADGGRTSKGGKGKTNINIVIAPQGSGQNAPMGAGAPPPAPPRSVPVPMPPQGAPGAPPGGMGGSPGPDINIMGGGGGMPLGGAPMQPPMGRKRGGKVMDAGAGSGVGRLEKIGKTP